MKVQVSAAICSLCLAFTASADQLISNGGFESGDLTGWTTASSAGSGGAWSIDSTTITPSTGNPTVGPNSGSYYAVTDGFGPGTNVLYQSFTDPLGTTSAVLSFDAFVNDVFGTSGFGGEVDLLAGNADPLTGTVIASFFSQDTTVSGGVPNPYVAYSNDISGLLTPGSTYLIRAYESDSYGPINFGVDDFSLVTTSSSATPEPATVIPTALLACAFAYRTLRRKARV
jgi:hypothetical protein